MAILKSHNLSILLWQLFFLTITSILLFWWCTISCCILQDFFSHCGSSVFPSLSPVINTRHILQRKKRTSSLWPFSEPLSIIKDLKSEGLELRLKLSYISAWTTQQGAGDNIFSIGGILSLGYGRHCMLCTVSCILHTVLCVCIIFWSHLIHILIV